MTIKRFRIAAAVLIGFNVLGTILTWVAHLQKSDIGATNAFGAGTQFTGPLVFAVIGAGAFAATYSSRRRLAQVGVFLLGLWGAGFAIGEVSELFQHNVGISSGRWDVVLVGAVIGAVIGITTAVLATIELVSERRMHRLSGAGSAA